MKNTIRIAFATAAAILALGLGGAGPVVAQEKIVILAWGGTWLDYHKRHMIEPFEEETGIKVEIHEQANSMEGWGKIRPQMSALPYDIWTTSPLPALLAKKEDLLIAPTEDQIPNLAMVPEQVRDENCLPWYTFYFGIAYREDMVPFEITKWEDLWDPRLEGLVTVPTADYAQGKFLVNLMWLAGGDERNPEPGFDLAQKLKPNIASFYKSDTDQAKWLESGEVGVAAFMLVGSFVDIAKAGPQFKFVAPKPWVVGGLDCFALMEGPNTENALKYLDFVLRKEPQENFAAEAIVIPANKEAKTPDVLARYTPSDVEYRFVDEAYVESQLPSWIERWTRDIQTGG